MEATNDTTSVNRVAFPVSPKITTDIIREISNLESEELAPGIVVVRNAFNIDQDLVLKYIDDLAEEAHRTRWSYIVGEDGEEYGINEDGFRYKLEDVPNAPVRLLSVVNAETPEKMTEFFVHLEEQIYKSLLKYIDYYPLMLGSIWWKTRGHVLRYGDGGILGTHADNDTNYKVTNGTRYMPKGMVASRQTCGALLYLNDCVDSEDDVNGKNFTGGHLNFVHLKVAYKPMKGDIIFFPTNYVASHNVTKMGKGVRYSYLTFFGQGADDVPANIRITQQKNSFDWCAPVWFDDIYDNYEMYCRSEFSRWANPEKYQLEMGWNPVYQGRTVVQYNSTHDAVVLDEVKEVKDNDPSGDLPEGPCGTEAITI